MRRLSIALVALALVVGFTSVAQATLIWDNINGPWVGDYPGIHDACGTPAMPEGELSGCEVDYVTNNNN